MPGEKAATRLARVLRDLHERVAALEAIVPTVMPRSYDPAEVAALLAVPPAAPPAPTA